MYPQIVTDLNKLKHNLDFIVSACHSRGISAGIVTKCVCAAAPIVELINKSDADFIADSRILNLKRIKTDKPKYLLRISQPCEAADTVEYCDISQQSELSTIRLLAKEAEQRKKLHKIVLMVDMGDLREGVFFKNREELKTLALAVKDAKMLELYGVGVNLTCFGGIIPDETNLSGLIQTAEWLRAETGLEIPFVSGGNSSSLPMLLNDTLPKGITNLRIGEGFLLGNETVTSTLIPGLYGDVFTLKASIAELKRKPSKPIGTSGLNAFGEPVSFEDRGEMLRAILAIGRQDVNPDSLTPLTEGAEVLGASSDHLIVNLTNAKGPFAVGDVLRFRPSYGAVLSCFTSEYVGKGYK